jgi:glycosyltransferase involved in cell wall biosynthesis
MRALKKQGYRVVAIAPRDEYSDKIEEAGYEYFPIEINNKGTNPFEDIGLIVSFYKLYKKVAPDIILEYTIKPNIYGSIAAKLLGTPVISNITGLGTVFLSDNISSKIARKLYRVALGIPKKVFFQNMYDKEHFIRSRLVKEEVAEIIPGSGINTRKFAPVERKNGNDRIFRFLFIARLLKDKGLVEYVNAAGQNKNRKGDGKDLEFAILGSYYAGNPTAIVRDEMMQWEKDDLVTYLGESDDVASHIADADCVVLPSYREGLSKVLLEAASMAKPIIAADVPGCREVVDDGVNGFLCCAKDAASLAEQIEKMIAVSEDERKRMGQKGREKVLREFDEHIVIERFEEAIRELLG